MESILIWFASGFSFVAGVAFGFFCFRIRPSKTDNESLKLMQQRNDLDEAKVDALERIVAIFNQPKEKNV